MPNLPFARCLKEVGIVHQIINPAWTRAISEAEYMLWHCSMTFTLLKQLIVMPICLDVLADLFVLYPCFDFINTTYSKQNSLFKQLLQSTLPCKQLTDQYYIFIIYIVQDWSYMFHHFQCSDSGSECSPTPLQSKHLIPLSDHLLWVNLPGP